MNSRLPRADDGSMTVSDAFRFTAIGTGWEIGTGHPMSEELRQRICSLAEDFDRVWSRFRADSLITRVAHAEGGGRFEFPARDVALFELYDRLVAATADGLATALFVSEPGRLRSFAFSWVRMLTDGRVQWSNDFAGELFL